MTEPKPAADVEAIWERSREIAADYFRSCPGVASDMRHALDEAADTMEAQQRRIEELEGALEATDKALADLFRQEVPIMDDDGPAWGWAQEARDRAARALGDSDE